MPQLEIKTSLTIGEIRSVMWHETPGIMTTHCSFSDRQPSTSAVLNDRKIFPWLRSASCVIPLVINHIIKCCELSCVGHLLLTSCPTLRAEEEEEEVEEEEEAWWRGLCLWGMWSRLGWDDAGPVWPCWAWGSWTQTHRERESWHDILTACFTLCAHRHNNQNLQ